MGGIQKQSQVLIPISSPNNPAIVDRFLNVDRNIYDDDNIIKQNNALFRVLITNFASDKHVPNFD